MKTIYSDAILGFGKYKNRAALDIAELDPGYFLWCVASGMYRLDVVLDNKVADWASDPANEEAARKSIVSGKKYAKEHGIKIDRVVEEVPESGSSESVSAEVSFASSASESWGTWS